MCYFIFCFLAFILAAKVCMYEIKDGAYDFKFIGVIGLMLLSCVPVANIILFVAALVALLENPFTRFEIAITKWIRKENSDETA